MKITMDSGGKFVKIFIDNILHMSFDQYKLIGIQSYINGKDWFCIELYIANETYLFEYNSIDKWKEILKLLGSL